MNWADEVEDGDADALPDAPFPVGESNHGPANGKAQRRPAGSQQQDGRRAQPRSQPPQANQFRGQPAATHMPARGNAPRHAGPAMHTLGGKASAQTSGIASSGGKDAGPVQSGADRWKNYAQKMQKQEIERQHQMVPPPRRGGYDNHAPAGPVRGAWGPPTDHAAGQVNEPPKNAWAEQSGPSNWRSAPPVRPRPSPHAAPGPYPTTTPTLLQKPGASAPTQAGKELTRRDSKASLGSQRSQRSSNTNPPRGSVGGYVQSPRGSAISQQQKKGGICYGVVTSLKDEFGFMQVVSEPQSSDVFFHYDELSKNGGGSFDASSLKLGDEIEFELVVGRKNRLSANGAKVLERGTIQMDKVMENRSGLYGVVISETFLPQLHHGRSSLYSSGHSHSGTPGNAGMGRFGDYFDAKSNSRHWSGRVIVLDENELESLQEIVPGNVTVAVADNIKCFAFAARGIASAKQDVSTEGSPKDETENNASVAKDDDASVSGKTDNGSISSKSTNGPRSGQRKARLLSPIRGDIVKFDVGQELATGKLHAVNIQIVKSISSRVKDICAAQIKKEGLRRERGRISSLAPSSTWNRNTVGMLECEERTDRVYFIHRDLPEKYIQKPGPKAPVPKKTTSDWRKPLDIHGKKPETNQDGLRLGVELEFYVVTDPYNPDRLLAFEIEDLAPGTVVFEEPLFNLVKATVAQVFRYPKKSAPPNPDLQKRPICKLRLLERVEEIKTLQAEKKVVLPTEMNKQESEQDAAQTTADESSNATGQEISSDDTPEHIELDICLDDLVTPGPKPHESDLVVLEIHRMKRTGLLVPRCVQVVEPSEEKERLEASVIDVWQGKCRRETGVVSSVRDSFGFIDCLDRPGQVFFPLKEVVAIRQLEPVSNGDFSSRRSIREELLQEGDPVSFQIEFDAVHGTQGGGQSGNRSVTGISGGNVKQLQNVADKRTVAVRVLKLKEVPSDIVLEQKLVGYVTKTPVNKYEQRKPNRRGPSQSQHQSSSGETGILKCSPSTFIANELFETLEKFSKDELYLDANSDVKSLPTQLDLMPDPNFYHIRTKKIPQNQHRRSGSSDKSYVMRMPSNFEFVVRDYCAWLGLRATFRQSDDAIDTPIVVKKRESQAKGGVSRGKKKDKNSHGEEATHTSAEGEEFATRSEPAQSESSASAIGGNTDENGTRVTEILVSFGVSAFQERKQLHAGDKVEFTLTFDRRTMRHMAHGITVLEGAKRKAGPVKRRPNTETGVVASLHEQGFGFIQSADRPDRIYFHSTECEGQYKSSVQPGDEVEFRVQEAKKGTKAVAVRFLPKGSIVVDDPVVNPDTGEQEKFRGVVVREPKRAADLRLKTKDDHVDALRIAQIHVAQHMLGKLVDSASVERASQKEEETYNKPDWRRAKELHNLVERFSQSKEKILEADTSLPKNELLEIERLARKADLSSAWIDERLVIARNRASIRDYKDRNRTKKQSNDTNKNENEDEDDKSDDEDQSKDGQTGHPADNKDEANDSSVEAKTLFFFFSLSDVMLSESSTKDANPEDGWVPMVGDEVEFVLCRNRATKNIRASGIKLLNAISKSCRGIVEGVVSERFGFIRPLIAGRGVDGDGQDVVDESFRPGAGGRDGSIRFETSQVKDGVQLCDGDEVEYILITDRRTKEARATRVRRTKQAQSAEAPLKAAPQLNRDALKKLGTASSAVAVQRFHMAKGPDGTNGFPVGRGRNLPLRTKLRVTAKEFKPNF